MKSYRLLAITLLIALTTNLSLAGNKIRVMGQNLENFFYILPVTGNELGTQSISNYDDENGRQCKMDAIVNAYFPADNSVKQADIYCFNEIECSDDILNYIATNFKNKTGRNYTYVIDGLDTYGTQGAQDIYRKSGFVYDADVVKPYGESTATGSGQVYKRFMRMQTFEEIASGERFTLSMNHFKAGSKNDPDDEGSSTTNGQRRIENANQLLAALPNALDPDILVMGDLNSYMDEECLQMLVNAGYEEQILRFHPNIDMPYWGIAKNIDHAFANSTMAEQITDANFYFIASRYSLGSTSTKAYSDHDPYMVEIELKHYDTPTYSFRKTTTVKDGGQYLIAATLNNNLEIAKPVDASKSYDYLYTTIVTAQNDIITLQNMLNAFTLEDAGNGSYYIKDSNGRYLHQTPKGNGYYTSVAVTSDRSNAHTYKPTLQTDGTFKILSQTGYYIYGTMYNSSPEFAMGNWSSLGSGKYLPWLYEYDPDIDTAVTSTAAVHATTTAARKLIVNGQLLIIAPNGCRYTPQGVRR